MGVTQIYFLVLRSDISMKRERPCSTIFASTERRIEKCTRSGVFLTNFEVFGNLVKHRLECLINLLNQTKT